MQLSTVTEMSIKFRPWGQRSTTANPNSTTSEDFKSHLPSSHDSSHSVHPDQLQPVQPPSHQKISNFIYHPAIISAPTFPAPTFPAPTTRKNHPKHKIWITADNFKDVTAIKFQLNFHKKTWGPASRLVLWSTRESNTASWRTSKNFKNRMKIQTAIG